MACTSGLMGTAIREFSRTERSPAKDIGRSLETREQTSTRENIWKMRSTGWESSAGRLADIIEVCTRVMLSRAMARCLGQMAVFTEASGMMASSMVWA